MLPLSILIVLMSMIVWAGVGAGLAPIARLRRLVEGRKPNDLRPIELDAAPQELRSLAQAINDLLEAVRHTVQGQRRFISDAAHQLRTPLAGLKSQSELALAEAPPGPLTVRLARVHESATRSAHLVNQLLALARTEPESLTRQTPVRFDLGRLAREVTAELVPRALQQNVDLGYDGPDSDPDCASASQLEEPLTVPGLSREEQAQKEGANRGRRTAPSRSPASRCCCARRWSTSSTTRCVTPAAAPGSPCRCTATPTARSWSSPTTAPASPRTCGSRSSSASSAPPTRATAADSAWRSSRRSSSATAAASSCRPPGRAACASR